MDLASTRHRISGTDWSDPIALRDAMTIHAGQVARPIRVGFVLHAMQVAGAEVLVKETIRQLAGRIHPTVFCLDGVGPLGEQLRQDGVEVVCLERRPGRDWRAVWRMRQALARRDIDVLHCHQYSPFFYGALAALLCRPRPRLILTEHGRHFPDVVSPLRRAVNRLLLDRLADAVNACSAFSARALGRNDGFAGQRIEVIPNGIHIDRYTPVRDRAALRRRLGLDVDRRYVINVARLHPVKDQASLLRAFARVAAHCPDADLLLVGNGPLRAELEGLAGELGIEKRTRFLGVRSDVPDLLRAADVFTLTSVTEAASLTLLEAMAAGLPVVVTDVGGNPEIVRDGREGLLVGRGDAEAMAAALLRLLDDADLAEACGEEGRQRVRRHYRLEHTIAAYEKLYRRLSR